MENRKPAILFYDGECGLCQGLVRFALKRSRAEDLAFAPLGGETAQQVFPQVGLAADFEAEAVLWLPEQTIFRGEAAVRAIFRLLPQPWSGLGGMIGWLPQGVRRWGYRVIARWRRRIAKPRAACPVPEKAQRDRLYP
ncbi:MAG: DUF393 domain-containing protein [Opitutales bacterium]|nr:DUF393 domain-containing protein [Opitutales bacterium]MCH8541333.1 DUF393 domain-containing protein [Opitutales bacterium]